MTFVHTFYSEPLYENKFTKFEESLENILYYYTLSAIFCKKFGHTIKLFTDEKGKQLLSHIPYDEVIVLDHVKINKHFAASFKFYALQQCELSDILIDGDIIIDTQKAFREIKRKECDVLFSFVEDNNYIFSRNPVQTYSSVEEYINDLLKRMNVQGVKYKLPLTENLEYMNTSLLRITNQNLKDEYIAQYFYHLNLMKDIDFGRTWPDLIVEQYFLKRIVEERDYIAKPIITKFPEGTLWERELGFSHYGGEKTIYLPYIQKYLLETDRNMYFKTKQKIKETVN